MTEHLTVLCVAPLTKELLLLLFFIQALLMVICKQELPNELLSPLEKKTKNCSLYHGILKFEKPLFLNCAFVKNVL